MRTSKSHSRALVVTGRQVPASPKKPSLTTGGHYGHSVPAILRAFNLGPNPFEYK